MSRKRYIGAGYVIPPSGGQRGLPMSKIRMLVGDANVGEWHLYSDNIGMPFIVVAFSKRKQSKAKLAKLAKIIESAANELKFNL